MQQRDELLTADGDVRTEGAVGKTCGDILLDTPGHGVAVVVSGGDVREGCLPGYGRPVRQGVKHLGGLSAGHFLVGKEPSVIGGHVVLCHTVVGGAAVPGVGFHILEVRAFIHRFRCFRDGGRGGLRDFGRRRLRSRGHRGLPPGFIQHG